MLLLFLLWGNYVTSHRISANSKERSQISLWLTANVSKTLKPGCNLLHTDNENNGGICVYKDEQAPSKVQRDISTALPPHANHTTHSPNTSDLRSGNRLCAAHKQTPNKAFSSKPFPVDVGRAQWAGSQSGARELRRIPGRRDTRYMFLSKCWP